MADKLTPEQMAELRRLFSTPVESGGDTNAYMPEAVYMDGRTYDKQDSGFLAYDYNPNDFTDPRTQEQQSLFNGSGYDQYGQDGSFANSGVFTGIKDSNKLGEFLTALAMVAAPVAMTVAGAGGAAGAAGGAAGGSSSGMVNGAFLGEGGWTATGGGALDFGAAGGAAGGAGAAGGGGGAIGTMAPMELLPTTMGEYTLPAAMGTGEGLLSGTAGSLIKQYGPGLLGAAIGGSQGKGKGGRGEMDPRLQSLLYGDDKTKGGFSYARGLLDAPVAPNGFERFYGGK